MTAEFSSDQIWQWLEDIADDTPRTPMDDGSRDFLLSDPMGWAVTRKRQFREALLSGDANTANVVAHDIKCAFGIKVGTGLCIEILDSLFYPTGFPEE